MIILLCHYCEDIHSLCLCFSQAKSSMGDRESLVAVAYEYMESGFTLVGCTAIEDRLQDGVPETIRNLAKVGSASSIVTNLLLITRVL